MKNITFKGKWAELRCWLKESIDAQATVDGQDWNDSDDAFYEALENVHSKMTELDKEEGKILRNIWLGKL